MLRLEGMLGVPLVNGNEALDMVTGYNLPATEGEDQTTEHSLLGLRGHPLAARTLRQVIVVSSSFGT